MNVAVLNILLHALVSVPEIATDIQAALNANWGKDHVQQALQGASVLSKIINDVAVNFEPSPSLVAQPITVAAVAPTATVAAPPA
jgi:hypothetical protein